MRVAFCVWGYHVHALRHFPSELASQYNRVGIFIPYQIDEWAIEDETVNGTDWFVIGIRG